MGRSGVSRAKNEKNSILIVKRRACRNLSKAAKLKSVAAPCCDVDANKTNLSLVIEDKTSQYCKKTRMETIRLIEQ
jgi:hypothetical protein